MLHFPLLGRLRLWLAVVLLVAVGAAAAAEPTLRQVYDAAQAGRLDEAQTMMQQVLVAHPDSAKAHFVHAELLLRRGHPEEARKALGTAEKLAPGLPFARAEAVEALRSRLSTSPTGRAGTTAARGVSAESLRGSEPAAAASAGGIPWLWLLVGGGAALALLLFLRQRKAATATGSSALAGSGFGGRPGAAAPVAPGATFGTAPGQPGFGQPGYGQPVHGQPGFGPVGYGQPGHAQPASGMGGRVMGGLATGLAVGAGVMAAQAIGKTLTGGNPDPAAAADGGNHLAAGPADYDMGGENFGVADSGSWDNGGDVGGIDDAGGDW